MSLPRLAHRTEDRSSKPTLDTRVAWLEQQHAELVALVNRLVGAGARDRADIALFATIALRVGGAHWTCRELVSHADPDLQRALRDADITSAHELGRLLGRCANRVIDGRVVRRARLRRGRASWWVDVVEMVEI